MSKTLNIKKTLKNAGAKRISKDAKIALKELIEKYANNLAKRAVLISEHTGRKTVTRADIKVAVK